MLEEGPARPLPVDNPRLDVESGQVLVAGGTRGGERGRGPQQVFLLFDCVVDKKEDTLPLKRLLCRLRNSLKRQREKANNSHSWSLLRRVTERSVREHTLRASEGTFSPGAEAPLPVCRTKEILRTLAEVGERAPLEIHVVSWFVPVAVLAEAAPRLCAEYLRLHAPGRGSTTEIEFASFLKAARLCSSYE